MSEPALAGPASAWEPPATLADRLSPLIRRSFKLGVAAVFLAWVTSQALWLIPTWRVSKRAGFQAFRQSVEADRGFRQALRGSLEADAFPESYSIGERVERYTLIARGADGVIRVAGEVREGRVVHQQSLGIATWRSAWGARKRRQAQTP